LDDTFIPEGYTGKHRMIAKTTDEDFIGGEV
jgi:hypothetical protein